MARVERREALSIPAAKRGSRRWGDFEDYLIPVEQWERERTEHYRVLQLPISADEFVEQLQKRLATVPARSTIVYPKING